MFMVFEHALAHGYVMALSTVYCTAEMQNVEWTNCPASRCARS
jgi:hypothetical protein